MFVHFINVLFGFYGIAVLLLNRRHRLTLRATYPSSPGMSIAEVRRNKVKN